MPKRKMSWVLIGWTVIFAIWIGTALGDRPSEDCPPGDTLCQDASDVGTGIGVGIVFFLFFLGFVVLSLIWFMTKPKLRICPACGTGVKRGEIACRQCGHDFARALRDPDQRDST